MLILSRRQKEKVLFPTLGISVEVVRSSPRKVQLGIQAPREIRVIRAELEDDLQPNGFQPDPTDFCEAEVRRDLNSAGMAIHLAQNQLRQGLDMSADEALEQALACLQNLEENLAALNPRVISAEQFTESEKRSGTGLLREKKPGYLTTSPPHDLADLVSQWLQGFSVVARSL